MVEVWQGEKGWSWFGESSEDDRWSPYVSTLPFD